MGSICWAAEHVKAPYEIELIDGRMLTVSFSNSGHSIHINAVEQMVTVYGPFEREVHSLPLEFIKNIRCKIPVNEFFNFPEK